VTTCEDLVISYLSPVLQNYTLVVAFGGEVTETTSLIDVGLPLSFDIGDLNESFTFSGYVRDQTGTRLVFVDPSTLIEYDCFQFKTKVSLTINQASITLNLAP